MSPRQLNPGRPRSKVNSNPSQADILRWGLQDVDRWNIRDTRITEDQKLYELTRPPKDQVKEGDEIVILNDPQVIIHKLSGMTSTRDWTLTVRPRVGSTKTYAQSLKNALTYWDEQINMDWQKSGHYSADYEGAFHVFLRGMICERISIIPSYQGKPAAYDGVSDDCPFPWDYFIADPANIYPRWSGKELIRVTHRQWLTPSELIDDPSFPDANPKDYNLDDDSTEEVLSIYYVGKLYDFHAALTKSGKWLKKPTKIGYMPWTITHASGAAYRSTSADTTKAWQRFASVGILSSMRGQMKDLNKATSMFQTMLAAEANPSVAVFTDDPTKVGNVSIKAGSKFTLNPTDKIQTMVVGPNLDHYQSQINTFQQRIGNATLPPSAYGGGPGPSSAMLNTQMIESALDIIEPYIQALRHAKMARYAKALKLFCEFFPDDTKLYAPTKRTVTDPDGSWTSLTAEQIDLQGYHLNVEYDTKTLQERLAIGNAVTALTNAKIISMETGRGPRWLAEPDPLEENEKVVTESLYQNPEVMKMLAPIFASRTGEEMLARINEIIKQGAPQQSGQPGQPPGPPQGAPPGMPGGMLTPPTPPPGMMGPGQEAPPPLPNPMLSPGMGTPPTIPSPPPSAVAPGMLGNPTAPPDLATLMRLLAARMGGSPFGSGVGGGGMGGVPPPPPMTNIPQ